MCGRPIGELSVKDGGRWSEDPTSGFAGMSANEDEMVLTRVFTGDDGRAQFGAVQLKTEMLAAAGGIFPQSMVPSTATRFITFAAGTVLDWHPAPRRQFVTILAGACEIELADGSRKRFGPGEILLVEDTKGQGHRTHSLGNQPLVLMFCHLE